MCEFEDIQREDVMEDVPDTSQQACADTETMFEEQETSECDYTYTFDGNEYSPESPYTRENTTELIGHNEYEEAQLASDLEWAEQYNEKAESLRTSDNIIDAISSAEDWENSCRNIDDTLARMPDVMHWSRDSYTEEYNGK